MAESRMKWLMLALAALTIMGSYYTYDSIAPVAAMLRDQRGFTQLQIGQPARSWRSAGQCSRPK